MAVRQPPDRQPLPGSGNRLWPVLAYLVAALLLVGTLLDGPDRGDLVVLAVSLLVVGVATVVYLRPAVAIEDDTLHLRQMLSDVRVPLAAVERASVGRFLAVFAGERRYVSTTVHRSLRSAMGARRGTGAGAAGAGGAGGAAAAGPSLSEADVVEQRIADAVEAARARHGVRPFSDEQLALARGVRRTWSPAAVAALAVPAVLLVLALLVA